MNIVREKEFDCVECGRHIVAIVWYEGSPLLCAHCIHIPGWHEHPELRSLLDPSLPPLAPAPD